MATAQRVARPDGYGRSTRFYEVDGTRLPSVTSILGAINKPALVNWAAKQEREMVFAAVRKILPDPSIKRENFIPSLELAVGKEKAHSKALTAAATIGSEAHGYVEWHVRRLLGQEAGKEPAVSEKALWAAMACQDWMKAVNLSVSLVENVVFSKRHGYAGTLDLAGDVDVEGGRVTAIVDFKTGKAIYREAHLQVAAYGFATVEMGLTDTMPAGCIVRLPKVDTDPDFEVCMISAERMKALHKVFLSVLELWKFLDEKDA